MSTLKTLSWALVAGLGAGQAQADVHPLSPVQVTASRQALAVDRSPYAVSVLTRAEIERSQASDVLELLRLVAGIDLARTGGPGASTSVFLRGTNSNHVLVLIDGVRVASANTGAFAFESLDLDQIERIEIVRGPHAALYGSDALGGVIQIFTRRSERAQAGLRFGSYGSREARVALGQSGPDGGLSLAVERRLIEGFSARNRNSSFGFDPDDDGLRATQWLLNGAHRFATGRIEAGAWANHADVEFDQGRSQARNAAMHLLGAGEWGAWSSTLRLGYAREALDTPAFDSRFLTHRTTLDWQNDRRLGEQTSLTLGAQWERQDGRSESLASGARSYGGGRDRWSLYGVGRTRFGAADLEAGVRHDDDQDFGAEQSAQLAVAVDLIDRVRGYANWGQGFRAPNSNELYSPGFGGSFAGNPDLDPERSRSLEAGLHLGIADDQRLTVRAYQTRIRDLIAFSGPNFRAINVNRAEIDGAELEYGLRQGAWSLDAQISYTDARDAERKTALLRRAREKAALSAYRQFEAWSIGGEWLWVGSRLDVGRVTLPSYQVLNLTLGWNIDQRWQVQLRAENVLDEQYELARGFNTPGRSAYLRVNLAL